MNFLNCFFFREREREREERRERDYLPVIRPYKRFDFYKILNVTYSSVCARLIYYTWRTCMQVSFLH